MSDCCSPLANQNLNVRVCRGAIRGEVFGEVWGEIFELVLGDQFLSSAGAGENCAHPTRLPDTSPVLDKNGAPMGPEILSSTGAGVWRKAPMAFPDSNSALDKFQSAMFCWGIQSKKTSAKSSAQKSHRSAQQNWRKFRKNFMTRFCRGEPPPNTYEGISAVGITFSQCNGRENRRSPATFDRKGIANLGASRSRNFHVPSFRGKEILKSQKLSLAEKKQNSVRPPWSPILPRRAPGQKDVCALRSEDST